MRNIQHLDGKDTHLNAKLKNSMKHRVSCKDPKTGKSRYFGSFRWMWLARTMIKLHHFVSRLQLNFLWRYPDEEAEYYRQIHRVNDPRTAH